MEWLKSLLAKIEAVTEAEINAQAPTEPIEVNERIISEVPVELRKILAYHNALAEKRRELQRVHDDEHDQPNFARETCEEFHRTIASTGRELKITEPLFWGELLNGLKSDAENIAIRADWKVVEIPEQDGKPSIKMVVLGGADLRGLLRT
jgi:hypothetical protein